MVWEDELKELNHRLNLAQQMGGKENQAMGGNMLPPRTPNYGKTPKYINKYKEEARQLAEEKEE